LLENDRVREMLPPIENSQNVADQYSYNMENFISNVNMVNKGPSRRREQEADNENLVPQTSPVVELFEIVEEKNDHQSVASPEPIKDASEQPLNRR
jgi:hypothetical protein